MTKHFFLKCSLSFFCGAVLLLVGTGCGPNKAKHEQLIRERHKQFVTALCQDNFDGATAVVAAESKQNANAVKMAYGAIRLGIGIAKLTPDNFRLDTVTLDDKCLQATVTSSTQTKGQWKADNKPATWVRVGEQWFLKF